MYLSFLLDYAESHLPPFIFDALKSTFENVYAVHLYLSQYLSEGLQLRSILPTLISIITLFLVVRSLYRSTMFAIRAAWWIFKWSMLVGGIAYLFGGIQVGGGLQDNIGGIVGRRLINPNMMHEMGNWMNSWLSSTGDSSQSRNSRMRSNRWRKAQSKRPHRRMESPPTIFDPFEAHRAYAERVRARERQSVPSSNANTNDAGEEGGVLRQIYEQVQGIWVENGRKWWETVGRIAGFTDDEDDQRTSRRSKQTTSR